MEVVIKDVNFMPVIASYIGLPDKEINLLKSLFRMLEGSFRTPIDIRFVDFNQYVNSKKIPDILFVNQDIPRAVALWRDIAKSFPLTTAIFVTNKDAEGSIGQHVLKRPISLKQIISTLQFVANLNDSSVTTNISSKLNILVIDDSFPVRKYMEHILPNLVDDELRIEYAADGEEAIGMTANKHYGLIFLDVEMPGLDGYQVCKFIKKKHRSYVVMLTSRKSPFDKVRGTMSGCNAYLVKPPKEHRLRKIIEKCLAKNNSSNLRTTEGLTYKY